MLGLKPKSLEVDTNQGVAQLSSHNRVDGHSIIKHRYIYTSPHR